jgi:uncharacterized membrane protein
VVAEGEGEVKETKSLIHKDWIMMAPLANGEVRIRHWFGKRHKCSFYRLLFNLPMGHPDKCRLIV